MESLLDDLEHESHTEIRVSERVSQRSEKRHSEACEAARKKNLIKRMMGHATGVMNGSE